MPVDPERTGAPAAAPEPAAGPARADPAEPRLACEEHELPDGRYLLAYRRAEHA